MTLKEEYQASLKSSDTEEWFDLHFHRPLGFLWSKFFAKLGVSPNAITVASIFMGVAGGILLYYGQKELAWLNWIGMLLITWADTFDSADGQLARLTQQYSRMGRILDGVRGTSGLLPSALRWCLGNWILATVCWAIIFQVMSGKSGH